MNALIAIAILALSFFGPGWSSEHKAYWEWQLGHPLEGYQEYRLSGGCHPDSGEPLLTDGGESLSSNNDNHAGDGLGFIPTEVEFAICSRTPLGDLCIANRF